MQTDLFDTSDGKHSIKHANFIKIRPISNEEVSGLSYSFQDTVYGEIIVASSKKRIHWVAFVESWREGLVGLSEIFPNIKITEEQKREHLQAAEAISKKAPDKGFSIYPVGTDFQVKVWKELLKIPLGQTITYGDISARFNLPKGASRAIGTAVGKNPIAYLIPCHRVIRNSGGLGGYRWGLKRKKKILIQEKKSVI